MIVEKIYKLLVHESGSKFYEIVRFAFEFSPEGQLQQSGCVTVRRWGKFALLDTGGGEIKIEHFDNVRQAQTSIKAVEAARKGYHEAYINKGLGAKSSECLYKDWASFEKAIRLHYSVSNASDLLRELGEYASAAEMEAEGEASDLETIEATKPEPIRPDDWASW